MRRNYISPEYSYEKIPGTLDMRSKSSFFSSIAMKLPQTITIRNNSIIWYETPQGEQIDPETDTLFPVTSMNLSEIKARNITLIPLSRDTYMLKVNIEEILRHYLYATLRKTRTFEGVTNTSTRSDSVELSIYEYIDLNILDKYRLSSVDLFLNYVNVTTNDVRKKNNLYSGIQDEVTLRTAAQPEIVENPSNLLRKKTLVFSKNPGTIEITFKQERSEDDFCFDYLFNLTFIL
jgi:hypothetical protein